MSNKILNSYVKKQNAKRRQALRKQREREREEHKRKMKNDSVYRDSYLSMARKAREDKHNYKMANDNGYRVRFEQKQRAKEEHKNLMKNDPLYAERYRIKQYNKKAKNKKYIRNSVGDMDLAIAKEIYNNLENKNRRERRRLEKQAIKQAKTLNKEYLNEEREDRKQRLQEARNKVIEERNNLREIKKINVFLAQQERNNLREIKKINVFLAQQERAEKRDRNQLLSELGKQKFESNLLGETKKTLVSKKLTHLDGSEALTHLDGSEVDHDIVVTEATKKLDAKGYARKRILEKTDLDFNKAIEDGKIFGEIDESVFHQMILYEEVKKIVDDSPENVKIKDDKVIIEVSNWVDGGFVNEEVEKTFEEFLDDAKYINEFNEEVTEKIGHDDLVKIQRNDEHRDEKTYTGNGKEDGKRSINKKITLFKANILKSIRTAGFGNYTIYRLFEAYDADSLTILLSELNEGELFDLFSSDRSFITNSFRKAVLAMGYKLDDVFEGKTIWKILEECNA